MYTVVPYRQARSAQLHWSFSTTSQLRWALCMLYKEQCRWPQTHCTTHVKSSLKEPQSLQTGHESRSEWNSMSWIRTWFKAWFIVTLHGVCCRRCSQPYNETAKEAVQAARRRAHLSQHVWLHTHTEKIDVKMIVKKSKKENEKHFWRKHAAHRVHIENMFNLA